MINLSDFVKNFDKIDEINQYLQILFIDLIQEGDIKNSDNLKDSIRSLENASIFLAFDIQESVNNNKPSIYREKIPQELQKFYLKLNSIFEEHQDLKDLAGYLNNNINELIKFSLSYQNYVFIKKDDKLNEKILQNLISKTIIIVAKTIN